MFDKLDDMLIHYEELMRMLGEPDVTQDTRRFTNLMKEQAELAPIVDAYKQYKQAKQDAEDSVALLEEETVSGHPGISTSTIRLRREDLLRYVESTGHSPTVIDLPDPAAAP